MLVITLSMFCCVQFTTIGIAAGYIFGGVIGPPLGWRAAFLLQVCLPPDSSPWWSAEAVVAFTVPSHAKRM